MTPQVKNPQRKLYELKLAPMHYRILFVTDVHMRDLEFKNTIGYVGEQERIILRIIEGAEKGTYNTIVLLGDLFDTSYKDPAKTMYHIALFERLNKSVKGRLFKVIGNHSLNKHKNYIPTFFLTGAIKSGRIDKEQAQIQVSTSGLIQNFGLQDPIIHAPDRLHVNGSLINLFHYNKFDKGYEDNLSDLTYTPKVHIGCYHDSIMPSKVRSMITEISNGGRFQLPTVTPVENSGIFKNIDYAMIGDIHTKIGEFIVEDTSSGKRTIADIPGSLGRTANHKAQQHNEVFLPLLDIDIDGNVKKEHIHVQLTDYRKIFKIQLQDEQKEQNGKLEDFKTALSQLMETDSFEDALQVADIEERTRDIISSILNDEDPQLLYRPFAEERKLLGRRSV